jgi:hypothetical protein
MASIVNARLLREGGSEQVVTMLAGQIDPRDRTLRGLNAGHPPLYVLDALGQIKAQITSTESPLGILPDAKFTASQSVKLVSGDLVLLFTDGLVEANGPTGPMFGMSAAAGRFAGVAAGGGPAMGLPEGSAGLGGGEHGNGDTKPIAEILCGSVGRLTVDGGPKIELATGGAATEAAVSVAR